MIKSLFLSNILLALVWVFATGTLTQENFLFGFLIAFGILWLITINRTEIKYFSFVPKILWFFLFVLSKIIAANLQTVKESLYKKDDLSPAIIKVPLAAKSDLEITFLANLICLTPGTMVLDVSDDKKAMYVHSLHCEDRDTFIKEIKTEFEQRLLDLMR
ncbi:Na(+) H(+) antiporter subunit E [Indibacter alkaliphilus LW1]|uniref:Na(+) H(+) antiporter subunit E n=1 Tax=Indibacter alkaliphilus (strain CCUG 57479 / KCTC 22604 / LW1) TaxID=1189612 RepID=S2DMN6_INDAL|nr:Na+/H+ antiporter subunit E [Indibacter alkaliphilus]EOZ98465.1 Na(+) H(+) antiporter subunit E [Indibacter alkaliphilus LW1]